MGEKRKESFALRANKWVDTAININSVAKLDLPGDEDGRQSKQINCRLERLVKRLSMNKRMALRCARKAFTKELNYVGIQKNEGLRHAMSQLIPFLDDIKERVKNMKSYEDEVNVLKNEWDEAIHDWRCEVDRIMKIQTENCKILMINLKNNLMSSHHILRSDIEKIITFYIRDINNMIISNERLYTETEIHLKLVFESLVQEWLVNFSVQNLKEEKSDSESVEEDDFKKMSIETRSRLVETEKVKNTVQVLVDCLFNYSKEELPDHILTTQLAMFLSQLDVCKTHICIINNEILFLAKKYVEKMTEKMKPENIEGFQSLWYEVLSLVGEKIVDSVKFIRDSTQIWNRFISRIQCVENHVTNNIDIERMRLHKKLQDAGEAINIAIDKLRQAKNIESLNSLHESLINLFDEYEKSRLEEKEAVESIISEFPNICFLAFDIYSAEMAVLRGETLPRKKVKIPKFRATSSPIVEEDEELFMALNDLKLCLESLQGWLDGYKGIIDVLENDIIYFLGSLVENWIDLKRGEQELWFDLEQKKTEQRKKRIKNDVYDVRESEIHKHEAIISRHRQGIQQMMLSLKTFPHNFTDQIRKVDNKTEKICKELEESLKNHPLQANLYTKKIENMMDTGNSKKRHLKKKFEDELERVTYWIKQTTLSLFKSIKLFGESGNFSHEEAENVIRTLHRDLQQLTTVKHEVVKKLRSIKAESKKAKKINISVAQFLLRVEELNTTQTCNNIMDQLKKSLKIEILNAKSYIRKAINYNLEAKENFEPEFWTEVMDDYNFYCNYFEMPNTTSKLEHESRSVYRGIYDPERESISKRPSKKKNRKLSESSTSTLSLWKSQRSSRYTKTPSDQRIRGKSRPKGSEMGSENDIQFGSYSMDYKPRKESHKEMRHAYPYPPLFYYTTPLKSEDDDNFMSNTKTMMINAFNNCKRIIMELATKLKGQKKGALLCGDLLHKYIIKIRKYNLQIEHVWLELLYSFISTLLGLKDCVNNLLVNVLENFHQKMEKSKNELLEKLKKEIEEDDSMSEKEKEKLEYELKPSYGYPLNVEMLEKIILKVLMFCDKETLRRKEALTKFEEVINETNRKLTEVVAEFHSKNEEIQNCLVENEQVTDFIAKIFAFMAQLSHKNINKSREQYLFVPTERRGRIMENLEGDIEYFEVVLGNLEVGKFIHTIIDMISQLSQDEPNNTESILVKSCDANQELKSQAEVYKKKMEQFDKEEIENFRTKCTQDEAKMKDWKLKWCHDVKCVRNLYQIKESFAPVYSERN